MRLYVEVGNKTYRLGEANDIAIPLFFNGPQPNTYGVQPATAQAYEVGDFVGDTRRGGSCNFERYTLVPHCNGTHTECVGHITQARISLHNLLTETHFAATLISITPSDAPLNESYSPPIQPTDKVIARAQLEMMLSGIEPDFLNALVIRTLPNDESKKSRDYMQVAPPFFSHEAMQYLVALGVQHLLVDFPSIDRLFDEGQLSNHRIFWGIPAGQAEPIAFPLKTITEMVFVPNDVKDGKYVLQFNYPAFVADAAPARPMLLGLIEK